MPVILAVPQDPADIISVIGELMRSEALVDRVDAFLPLITDDETDGTLPLAPSTLIAGLQGYAPMQPDAANGGAVLRSLEAGNLMGANGSIATPCGALVPLELGRHLLVRNFIQSTETFVLTGQTVTGAGAALAGCRVVVYETGRIAVVGQPQASRHAGAAGVSAVNPQEILVGQSAIVAEATSDGSGNFAIAVPMNVAYQLTGYLAGSPDRAGITKDSVVPGSVPLIYLRDPTAADSGGAGGNTYSRGRVVNA